MPDLLLELRSEEIPARMQAKGAELLRGAVESRLKDRGLDWKTAEAFVTPRRLALIIRGLPDEIPESREERRGPRVGAPEKALAGFLRSTGVTRKMLEVRGRGADAAYFAVWDKPAQPLREVLAVELPQALRSITWPKSMRWGRGNFRWVRPLRSILCIVDDDTRSQVVELDVEGIPCGRVTCGHPYMAPDEFVVESVDSYESSLYQAKVILRAEKRRDRIMEDVNKATEPEHLGLASKSGESDHAELLDEIAGLVEWPVVLAGRIGSEFSDLPSEILRVSIRKHQKFFSLVNPGNFRITHFAGVADIKAADGGMDILEGYKRVLAARLADARFFWENDLRTGIKAMSSGLSEMIFHSELGSMAARTERISKLAEEIANHIGESPVDMLRAGEIAKIDLCSETVREFPELQGTAGALLAQAAGENRNVFSTVLEQYSTLPLNHFQAAHERGSAALILADRADMLWGLFAVGERPTGSRDPYALRRAALDISWTLIGKEIHLSLHDLMAMAEKKYGNTSLPAREDASAAVVEFMLERLRVYLRGFGSRRNLPELVGAVSRRGTEDNPYRFWCQFLELGEFFPPEPNSTADDLLTTYRRITSILDADDVPDPDPALYRKREEHFLAEALDHAEGEIKRLNLSEGELEKIRKEKRGRGRNLWTAGIVLAKLNKLIDHFSEKPSDVRAINDPASKLHQDSPNALKELLDLVLPAFEDSKDMPVDDLASELRRGVRGTLVKLRGSVDRFSKNAVDAHVNHSGSKSRRATQEDPAQLCEPIKRFFEDVHINDPNPQLRLAAVEALAVLQVLTDRFSKNSGAAYVNDSDSKLRHDSLEALVQLIPLVNLFVKDTKDVLVNDPTPELRQAILVTLAKLRGPADRFFESVHVNDSDPQLRRNRRRLLARARTIMEQFADFGAIQG